MKLDMDRLMKERGIDALWVTGSGDHNPNMVYYTGLHLITAANLIKLGGKTPVLFHNAMEREEALKTGLETRSNSNYLYSEYLKKTDGDVLKAHTLIIQAMLNDLGISSGKLAVSGWADVGVNHSLFLSLQKNMPEIEILGELQDDLFNLARMTKDTQEIDRIRKVGQLTAEIVGLTAEYLSHHRETKGVLVDRDGQPITIADVKQKIRLWIAKRYLESTQETIFALGRDAGIPHSAGNPDDVIRTGMPIVFDIFPCEMGGGYCYDFTRTWCLGFAPDEVVKLYEQVRDVYETIIAELKTNIPFSEYQKRACELFANMGHATIMEKPDTEEGYVHSLGHGVGLAVHEKPFSGVGASPMDVLQPGVVITVEPGLYYPSRRMGVRLEDTLYATEQGEFKIFAEYPLDLVIPLKK